MGMGGRKSRVEKSFIDYASIQAVCGLEMESLQPSRGMGGDESTDSISSIYPESVTSAEAFPLSNYEFVDDISSCEDALKTAVFEGEDGILSSFFTPIVESIVVSNTNHEEEVS